MTQKKQKPNPRGSEPVEPVKPTPTEEKVEKGPTEMQTLMGGQMLPVKLRDGSVEDIKVLQLPYADFDSGKFARTIGEGLVPMIALYTGKTKEWVETLDPESFGDILELGRQLNFPTFELCDKYRKEHAEWIALKVGMMQTEIAKLIQPFLSALQNSQLPLAASPTKSTGKKSPSRKSN